LTFPHNQTQKAICMTKIYLLMTHESRKISPCHHASHHGKTRYRQSS
jgi:hypothetical protein